MKTIPPRELKVPMCGRSLFLTSHDVDVIRPELCCVECITDRGGCFSMLVCMLNNVLDMGRDVVFIISI
jgi:hypothetical protein